MAAGNNQITRFLESLRDATRVLDAYSAKVRDGARAVDQSSAAATRAAAAQLSSVANAGRALGGAAIDASVGVATKAYAASLTELSATTEAIARRNLPDFMAKLDSAGAAVAATQGTKEWARNLADVGFKPTEQMIQQDQQFRFDRLDRRQESDAAVEKALGNRGESFMGNIYKAQQLKSHR